MIHRYHSRLPYILAITVALFSTILLAALALESPTHPVLLWSGPAHHYLESSTAATGSVRCSTSSSSLESVLSPHIASPPPVTVAFVLKNTRTSDLMRMTGAYSQDGEDSAFTLLRERMIDNSNAHKTLFGCALRDFQTSDSFVVRGNAAINKLISELDSATELRHKNILVLFDAVDKDEKRQFQAIDSMIDKITYAIGSLTGGHYIAAVTSDIGDLLDDFEQRQHIVALYNIRSFDTLEDTMSNATYVRTELYIDSNGLTGIVIGLLLLSITGVAFYLLSRISASPHIADAFEAEEQKKKMQ